MHFVVVRHGTEIHQVADANAVTGGATRTNGLANWTRPRIKRNDVECE
jgi:hypothetical protein